ncbi:hypothetical protein [Nocardia blacklockiae]|uniref:hypothetical protein n=1 Tax=Nocardia blacklockiae TaxID=480036 RepID=UPI0018952C6D|nr:hypothetical protein [Nocardia blacklockiae]MBF6171117.1 hypothetical protein [Nocardia blacklockiae]
MSTAQSDNLPGRRDNRRLRSRLAWHLLLACTVVSCLGLLVYASDPAGAESALWKLFLTVAAVAFFFGMVGYLAGVVVSRRLWGPELGPLFAPALVVACTVAAWSADLPIVVRWQFSEHSFEDAARQVRDGVDPWTFEGHRLGLYRVDDSLSTSSIRDASGIYFATSRAAGYWALNYCSRGAGFAQLTGAPANGKLHHLSGDWYWFCFDGKIEERPIGG